jgi:hypothetical protein
MDFRDFFGTSDQGERRDEKEIKRTFIRDQHGMIPIGGKFRREIVDGAERIEEENLGLFLADDGVTTTTDPLDQRYPYIVGKDYQGNLVSAGNLNRCREKGCYRMVSSISGVEYKPGLWRCRKHNKKYNLRQFIKALLSPFYNFKKED